MTWFMGQDHRFTPHTPRRTTPNEPCPRGRVGKSIGQAPLLMCMKGRKELIMADLVAFARVSTQRQAQFGESLAEQFERIETYARQNQHTIIGRFADEGLSGRTLVGRDGIQQAVALTCRQRGRILCVTSLSRVARNVRDCLDIGDALRRSGSSLASITEGLNGSDATSRLVWNLLSSIHAWIAEIGAANTSMVLRSMDARGLRTSGEIKYGYRLNHDGRTISPDEGEQAVIARIIDLRQREDLSWAKIGDRLTIEGIRTRSGKERWLPKVIAGIYSRESAVQKQRAGAA